MKTSGQRPPFRNPTPTDAGVFHHATESDVCDRDEQLAGPRALVYGVLIGIVAWSPLVAIAWALWRQS